MRRTRVTFSAALAVGALTLAACTSDPGEPGESDETTAEDETTDDEGEATGDSDETLRIGIKFDQPGLGYQDGADYTGFDVDVAVYVAEALGYSADQIQWIEAPTPNRETLLETGQVDMIFATYSITDARDEVVDFAGPYFISGQDLLVRADETAISGPEDLDGLNLCSVSGSTSAQRIKDDYADDAQLIEQPGYSECIQYLIGGQVDAITTDDIILAGLAAAEGEGNLRVVGNPFSEEHYGVGIPEGSTELCEQINEAILQMFEDGSWDEAVQANTEGTGYSPNEALNPPEMRGCA